MVAKCVLRSALFSVKCTLLLLYGDKSTPQLQPGLNEQHFFLVNSIPFQMHLFPVAWYITSNSGD